MFKKKPKKLTVGRQPRNRQLRSNSYSYFSSSRDGMDGLVKVASDKKNKKSRPFFAVLGLLLLLFLFFYEVFLDDMPKVVIQKGTDNRLLQNKQAYAEYAKKLIDKNISNRDKITVNSLYIDKQLMNKFPEIASASLSIPILGNQPILNIAPTPVVLILSESDGRQYAVSNSGVTVAKVNAKDYQNIPVLKDGANLLVGIGSQELPQAYIGFIKLLVGQLKAQNVQINSLNLAPDGELDLYPRGVSYYVKFNLNDSGHSDQQIGDFFAVKQYLIGRGVTSVHYIDVRVPGRAFYK